jgi:hypothetical protein
MGVDPGLTRRGLSVVWGVAAGDGATTSTALRAALSMLGKK